MQSILIKDTTKEEREQILQNRRGNNISKIHLRAEGIVTAAESVRYIEGRNLPLYMMNI